MATSRVATLQPQATGPSDLVRFMGGSGIGSMNMDDIMRNIYGNAPPLDAAGGLVEPVPVAAPDATAARRTSEEVWKEISAAGGLSGPAAPLPPPPAVVVATGAGGGGASEMTLEDFLARDTDAARAPAMEGTTALGFPDGDMVAGAGAGRARKRAHMDPTDRAVVQRQKRMIKNRESAARSRDRKQVR
jgi:ABA responsive element binding factor